MTRLTIKWVFFVTLLALCFSPNFNRIFGFFPNQTRVHAAVAAATPELPRVLLDTTYTAPIGRAITVNAGGDLQAAINQAAPGDTILLQAGATFTGNFTLPNKTGTGWIVIRTSTPDGSLPAQGTRITPQNAGLLPKIMTATPDAAIRTMPGAHNYRLMGLEIGMQSGSALNYGIVCLGDGSTAQNSMSMVPQDIIVDRCYIHGNSTGDVSRGVGLNSGRTAVIDSFISQIHGVGLDTQAIGGWNGPGPFKIVNNYLEGSGENFMLGGADPAIPGLIPSDVEFRNNLVYKPLSWKVGEPSYAGIHWSVKNLFELKNAQRVLVDGNVFENNWADAQAGFAVVLKSVNQDGAAPWSTTADVTFTNNIIRHSGAGLNVFGNDPTHPAVQMTRLLIRNNLWDDINGPRWGGSNGKFLQISNTPNVIVDHNTVIQSGDITAAYDQSNPNFVFTNNILAHGPYGVKGDGTGVGNDTINTYFPAAAFTKNVLAGGTASNYPAGHFFPTTLDSVGFVNSATGDYRLSSTSPYRNAGTDGQDLGYVPSGAAPLPTPSPTPGLAITSVVATSITASSATITWVTNQFTDSQVEYGATTSYGQQTPINPTLLTSHVEIISGLVADTVYNFRVKSKTSTGTLAVSPNFTFRTVAIKPPPTPTPTPIPTPTPTPVIKPTPTPTPIPPGTPPPTAPVTWTKLRNVTVLGSVLKKTYGCDGCRSSAVSAQTVTAGDVFMEFTAVETNKQRWAGLMFSGKTVTTGGLDFAIMLGNGEAAVFELGVFKTEVLYVAGDKLRIAIQGGVVRYYKNGVLFYTSQARPVYPLVTAAWIDQMSGTVANAVMVVGSTTKPLKQ